MCGKINIVVNLYKRSEPTLRDLMSHMKAQYSVLASDGIQ